MAVVTNNGAVRVIDAKGKITNVDLALDKVHDETVLNGVSVGTTDAKLGVVTTSGNFKLIDSNGTITTTVDLGLDKTKLEGIVSSASVGDKAAVITSTGKLKIIDESGKTVVNKSLSLDDAKGEVVRASVTADNGTLLTLTDSGTLFSITDSGKISEVANVSFNGQPLLSSKVTSRGIVSVDNSGNVVFVNKDGSIRKVNNAVRRGERALKQAVQIGDKIYYLSRGAVYAGYDWDMYEIHSNGNIRLSTDNLDVRGKIYAKDNLILTEKNLSSSMTRPIYYDNTRGWVDMLKETEVGELNGDALTKKDKVNEGVFTSLVLLGDKIVVTSPYGSYYTKHLGGNKFAPWKIFAGKLSALDDNSRVVAVYGERLIFRNISNINLYSYLTEDRSTTHALADMEAGYPRYSYRELALNNSNYFSKDGSWYNLAKITEKGHKYEGVTGLFVAKYNTTNNLFESLELVANSDQLGITTTETAGSSGRFINDQMFIFAGNKVYKLRDEATGDFEQIGQELPSGEFRDYHNYTLYSASNYNNGNFYVQRNEGGKIKVYTLKDKAWVLTNYPRLPINDSIHDKRYQDGSFIQ